jgi:hypothetical protein
MSTQTATDAPRLALDNTEPAMPAAPLPVAPEPRSTFEAIRNLGRLRQALDNCRHVDIAIDCGPGAEFFHLQFPKAAVRAALECYGDEAPICATFYVTGGLAGRLFIEAWRP